MAVVEGMERLVEKMGPALAAALEAQTDTFRRLANDSGIFRRMAELDAALDGYTAAQDQLRSAVEAERVVVEAEEQAVMVAEWELGGRIVKEGNKTFLDTGVRTDEGEQVRRQVTAEEAKSWVAAEAKRQPEVDLAGQAVLQARHQTAIARDAVAVCDKRIGAARAQLAAATAVLQALTSTIER